MPRKNYTIVHDEHVRGPDRRLDVAKIAFPETKFAEAESFNFSAFGLQPELSQYFAQAFFAYGFDKRPATRKAVYDAIKRFFEFLDSRSPRGNRIERPLDLSRDVFNEYRRWLLARQTKAGASVYYNTTRRVVLSLSRVAPEGFPAVDSAGDRVTRPTPTREGPDWPVSSSSQFNDSIWLLDPRGASRYQARTHRVINWSIPLPDGSTFTDSVYAVQLRSCKLPFYLLQNEPAQGRRKWRNGTLRNVYSAVRLLLGLDGRERLPSVCRTRLSSDSPVCRAFEDAQG